MARQQIAASIFDINLPATKATLVALAVLVVVLTVVPTALAQTFTLLHLFNGSDGAEPIAGVTRDAAGNLYGTTYQGGENDEGLVYKLGHRGTGWVLTPLYSFQQGRRWWVCTGWGHYHRPRWQPVWHRQPRRTA